MNPAYTTTRLYAFVLRYLFILCCCLFLASNAHAQWQWLNPKPSGYSNLKVAFINRDTGFILNSNGDLYKTTNMGNTWVTAGRFSNALTMDIKDSLGIISGVSGTLYLSNDNGTTWKQITTGINDVFSNINIINRDTFFLSSNNQFSYGNIYQTNDTGKTFIKLNCGVPIHSISFVNSKIGYVGTSLSTILKTTDGGITWHQKHSSNIGPSSILAMQSFGADTVFAVQESNSLLTTYNGGKTWRSSSIGSTFEGFAAIDFINTNDGYIGGSDGALYATHNGGKKFVWAGFDGLRQGDDIYSINFFTKDTGFAVGMLGRIIKTTNSGSSWSAYSPTYLPITAVSFGTASTGYAASWNNLYKTIDKGKTWNQLNLTTGLKYPSSSRFEKAYFKNADSGIVTSSKPVQVHETFDGGNTWDTINFTDKYGNDYENVNDLQFINKDTGFITVQSFNIAALMKTTDGGHTWKKIWIPSTTGEFFDKICYLNEDTGYATRYSELYKTTNGSKTWKRVYFSPYSYKLTAVSFTNVKKGFITDEYGNIISTKNGGSTWKTGLFDSIPVEGGISTLKMYNEQFGYLIDGFLYGPTDYGNIFKTSDSGKTWQFEKNVGGNSITFTPDSLVIVAGYGGAILSSEIDQSVLAVQTIKLNAHSVSDGVLLNWQAASALNSNYFTIERSTDAVNYKVTAKVQAKNNSTSISYYSFSDTTAFNTNAKSLYYRIHEFDKDGHSSYSNIVRADIAKRNFALTIKPNPAVSGTAIDFGKAVTVSVINVFDEQGKKVLSVNLNNQLFSSYYIHTFNLSSGFYTIAVQADNNIYTGKLVIKK